MLKISINYKALDDGEMIYRIVQSWGGSVEGQEELYEPKMVSVMLTAMQKYALIF